MGVNARAKLTLIFAGVALAGAPAVYLALGLFDLVKIGWREMELGPRAGLLGGALLLALALLLFGFSAFRRVASAPAMLRLWLILLGFVFPICLIELASGAYLRLRYPPQKTYTTDRLVSPLYRGV